MDLFIALVALFFIIIIIYIYIFNNNFYLFIFLYFFLPFLQSHVAHRVLVLWPGVRPEPLR